MARKNKKASFGALFVTFVICLVLGIAGGAFANCYFFMTGYTIPQTILATGSVSAGNIDVDIIKSKDLSIHFIELGNKYTGDCTLIKAGDVEILVDAGSKATSVEPIYDYVSQYISNDGILDYVIVTHAHQDHYAGFATGESTPSLFDKFNTKTIVTFAQTNQKESSTLYKNFNRELTETKQANGTNVYSVLDCYNNITNDTNAQRTISLTNNINLIFLYQKYYEQPSTTENNYSVCFMIEQVEASNNKYYMFTGDLEDDGEESLVDSYTSTLPKVELYKAGHHGSKTSSSNKLLQAIQPNIVCVCCCAGSSEYTKTTANQFPTQDFINRISVYTTQVFVTSLCENYNEGKFTSFNGNIVVTSNFGETVNVQCSNSSTVLKDTDWFKQNRTCPEAWE